MKIVANAETIDAIKGVMAQQNEKPSTVRIFMAGMGCSGPTFGLALDDEKEGDLVDESNGIKFVADPGLIEQYGDIKVEFMEDGYYVAPVNQPESSCGSCGGGCH